MDLEYLHLRPEQNPPEVPKQPRRVVAVAESEASEPWRQRIADWLVKAGCLYFIAWGRDCSLWHDSVDWAVLDAFEYGDIPDEQFVMTTWHANEPLKEAFWFAGNCATHPDVELDETLILHIAELPRGEAILQEYADSQVLEEDS